MACAALPCSPVRNCPPAPFEAEQAVCAPNGWSTALQGRRAASTPCFRWRRSWCWCWPSPAGSTARRRARKLFAQLRGLLGTQGAEAIQLVLAGAQNKEEGRLATLVAGGCCWRHHRVCRTQASLDEIWQVPPLTHGTWDVVRTRLLSFGMVLVLAFLLMVSLVVSAAMAMLENTGAACGATRRAADRAQR
jgi:hypothetical protein